MYIETIDDATLTVEHEGLNGTRHQFMCTLQAPTFRYTTNELTRGADHDENVSTWHAYADFLSFLIADVSDDYPHSEPHSFPDYVRTWVAAHLDTLQIELAEIDEKLGNS